MAVRLKDIARESGVSISTVSRILSNDTSRKANSKTIAKVFATAERLGYFHEKVTPAHFLEYFNPHETYSVGCILTSEEETYVSPFFSALLAGIQHEIIKQGPSFPHNFFVAHIKDPGFVQFIQNTRLDCAIMLGRTSLENIEMLKANIANLVYAGVNKIGNGIDEVLCDAREAVLYAIDHLINLGHRSIGFIGPTKKKHRVFNEHRYEGFLDAMKNHGLAVNPDYVVETMLTASDGYESMQVLIKRNHMPTAVFCGNDTVALGVMKALDEHQIRIPEDISIVGFDNIETVRYLKPALTTIDIPKQELGRLAVKVLLDRIESKREYSIKVNLPFTLIVRESCRAIGNE
ncbi:MAG: LacI family DNA-binding transcriptional regulator [Sphaerochaetaceae bacterium]|nr:LacI family DNA-binding transcriptional regulator [Sphaerochaetaceae bacterium]